MRTKVILLNDVPQSNFKRGDTGYIDGYVQAADSRPYAVMVRDTDGRFELVSTYAIKAQGVE